MASFEEILNRPAAESKAPEAFPVGRYHCMVDGRPEPGKSSQKQTDFLRFKFKIIAPDKGVDPEKAAEMQLPGKIIYNDYYITDTAAYRLGELLEHLGVKDPKDEKTSFSEMLSAVPGRQLYVTLRHELSQDGKRVFHRVAETEAV